MTKLLTPKIIGMAHARSSAFGQGLFDGSVVFGTRILIANDRRNRRSEGFSSMKTRENFDLIRLVPRRNPRGLPWSPAIKSTLNLFTRKRNARRTAINHAAERDPVALSERRDLKEISKSICSTHVRSFGVWSDLS
jgi:hypothetical protein